jgi:hypothetical protein
MTTISGFPAVTTAARADILPVTQSADTTTRKMTVAQLLGKAVAADVSDSTAAGRAMVTAADVAAQTALLNAFTSAAKGLAPASGGGTANFLRADGTWAAPAGGGTPGGSANQVQYNSASAFGGIPGSAVDATGAVAFAATGLTASVPFTFTQAWNAGGVTFVGALFNFTGTSNNLGLLVRVQRSGSDRFTVNENGDTSIAGAATMGNGVRNSSAGVNVISAQPIGFSSSSTNAGVGPDTAIMRDAAGQLAVTSGTAGAYRDIKARTAIRTGGVQVSIAANKTGAYTATATDEIIPCDASGGAFSVTLPTAVGVPGQRYVVKKVDSSVNAVTVATTSSQTIDGATTYSLAAQWDSVRVVSNGANWLKM